MTKDKIIIHYAATPNGSSHNIDDIDNWHLQRGFSRSKKWRKQFNPYLEACGYNAVIPVNGDIQLGRHPDEPGAHTRGYNRTSLGVCLIGTDAYEFQQWNALAQLVEMWSHRIRICGIDEMIEASVHGHNEFSKKSCPGFDVQEWLAGGMKPLKGHIL